MRYITPRHMMVTVTLKGNYSGSTGTGNTDAGSTDTGDPDTEDKVYIRL